MATYFIPQDYESLLVSFDALRKAYYFTALSNATLEGKDIFDRFEDELEDEEPATEE